MEKEIPLVFMGTPAFAVGILEDLILHHYNVAAVVTAPDKPAGRGLQVTPSPVKMLAEKNNIPVFQPLNLSSETFIKELKAIDPLLIVVVAFRMLPDVVWSIPSLGTFNLHASLLPQYRGAAPINHAIINGEKTTGLTTFIIDDHIDTGQILLTRPMVIGDNTTAGALPDEMIVEGKQLVRDTIHGLVNKTVIPKKQPGVTDGKLLYAPKINKEFCRINWNKPAKQIHNFIRGLSPSPGAYTTVRDKKGEHIVKFLKSVCIMKAVAQKTLPEVITDDKTFIHIILPDGIISIEELQMQGKKRMSTTQFLRGYRETATWKLR
jgi:methionyl-tRNA formyltransferase